MAPLCWCEDYRIQALWGEAQVRGMGRRHRTWRFSVRIDVLSVFIFNKKNCFIHVSHLFLFLTAEMCWCQYRSCSGSPTAQSGSLCTTKRENPLESSSSNSLTLISCRNRSSCSWCQRCQWCVENSDLVNFLCSLPIINNYYIIHIVDFESQIIHAALDFKTACSFFFRR